jgi:hypothetical protein
MVRWMQNTPFHLDHIRCLTAVEKFYNDKDTRFSYLKPVFNGISRAILGLNCNLLFGCGMELSASPMDHIRPGLARPHVGYRLCSNWLANTEGVIVFSPMHSPIRSQYIQNARDSRHPVAFVGSGETRPTIVAYNSSGIFEAIGHLIRHGYQQIGFIAVSPDEANGNSGDRLRVYQAGMVSYGLESDQRIIIPLPSSVYRSAQLTSPESASDTFWAAVFPFV